MNKNIAILSLATVLTGCAGLPSDPTPVQMKAGDVDVISTSAERQIMAFHAPNDAERFCLAPPPDVVGTLSGGLSAAVGTESVSESMAEGADSLGGRSSEVLLAREIFYRTCEFTLNHKLSKQEALDLYRTTLDVISDLDGTKLSGSGSPAGSGTPPSVNPPALPAGGPPGVVK